MNAYGSEPEAPVDATGQQMPDQKATGRLSRQKKALEADSNHKGSRLVLEPSMPLIPVSCMQRVWSFSAHNNGHWGLFVSPGTDAYLFRSQL